jgi:hypothetical protein
MYRISHSWVNVQIFYVLLSGVVYLPWCDFWQLIRSSSVATSARSFYQIASNDAAFLSSVITGDESWIYGYDLETKQQSSQWKMKSKVKRMSIIFLTWRGLLTKNSSWQAKHSIPHTTVTFYGDCMKVCEDFVLNFGGKKLAVVSWQSITLFFSLGNFWPKTTWLSCSTHPTFLCFLDWR